MTSYSRTLIVGMVAALTSGVACATDDSLQAYQSLLDASADGSVVTGGMNSTGGTTGGGLTTGTGGTATGGATGSCNPAFCPGDTTGTACCVSPSGPCGVDFGMGCVDTTLPDGGP